MVCGCGVVGAFLWWYVVLVKFEGFRIWNFRVLCVKGCWWSFRDLGFRILSFRILVVNSVSEEVLKLQLEKVHTRL